MTTSRIGILLIHDGVGSIRGSESVMLTLIEGTRASGFKWQVLTNHLEFHEAVTARGLPSLQMPFQPLFVAGRPAADLAALHAYMGTGRAFARQGRIDLIHINNGTTCNWAVPLAWWLGVPALVHLHSDFSRRNRFLFGIHLADRILGVSQAVLQRSQADPIAAGRLKVIYNGLDRLEALPRRRADARATLHLEADQLVIGVAAFLIGPKRVDVAIAALRHLPEPLRVRTVLLVIGDGPDRAMLEAQAAGLPVRFLGYRSDVHDLMLNVLDLFVLPSEMEAFSIALLEAAAAALPRIGAAAGGTPESIIHDQDGLIVPPGDPVALAAAIADLAAHPDQAMALGQAARTRLHREFSVSHFLCAFQAVYRDMLSSPAPRWRRISEAVGSIWHQAHGQKATG